MLLLQDPVFYVTSVEITFHNSPSWLIVISIIFSTVIYSFEFRVILLVDWLLESRVWPQWEEIDSFKPKQEEMDSHLLQRYLCESDFNKPSQNSNFAYQFLFQNYYWHIYNLLIQAYYFTHPHWYAQITEWIDFLG